MIEHQYTACYCEENIWHLCSDSSIDATQKQVLWVGCLQHHSPLWCQRASVDPEQDPVWWDYHVILLVFTDQWRVWDLDTTLPLGVPANEYFLRTFRAAMAFPPLFRVMDSDYYQRCFSSDRSHMLDANQQWLVVPPSWPPIQNEKLTFSEMLDFTSNKHGTIMGFNEALRHFDLKISVSRQ